MIQVPRDRLDLTIRATLLLGCGFVASWLGGVACEGDSNTPPRGSECINDDDCNLERDEYCRRGYCTFDSSEVAALGTPGGCETIGGQWCQGECIYDIESNNQHCGTCTNACAGQHQECRAHRCRCRRGYADCDDDGDCECRGRCDGDRCRD